MCVGQLIHPVTSLYHDKIEERVKQCANDCNVVFGQYCADTYRMQLTECNQVWCREE